MIDHDLGSEGERAFEIYWHILEGPDLVKEHRFHPSRKWRIDFAHLPSGVGIEIDGGTWTQGRHTRGTGFENDCKKINAATAMGWRIFRFTPTMLAEDPYGHLTPVIEAIKRVPGGIQHWEKLKGFQKAKVLTHIEHQDSLIQTVPTPMLEAWDKWLELSQKYLGRGYWNATIDLIETAMLDQLNPPSE